MEYRELEVTLISAQNLKKVNAFGKMEVYGVAWIYPSMQYSSPTDRMGNVNPTWNSTLKLTVDERYLQNGHPVVHIDLYHHGSLGNQYVGSSSIPLRDNAAISSSSIITIPVVRRSGKARGTLNVSVKLGEVMKYPDPPPVVAYPPGSGTSQVPYFPYGGYAPPPPPRYGGLGGGFGTGLLGGALGGLLLGSILGDGGGFGGCGGF